MKAQQNSEACGGGRTARLLQVLEATAARRAAGEAVPDASVIATHPDLMPELGERLRTLARIEGARRRPAEAPTVAGSPDPLADTLSAPQALPSSDSFAGYQLLREIHRGGQGVVYQALQHSTKRKVAIKVMREGPFAGDADKARFEREVQILGQLQHPNIVGIHDSGSAGGSFYFVMDYISGQPLDEYMAGAADGARTRERSIRSPNSRIREQRRRARDGERPAAAGAPPALSVESTLRLFAKICEAVNAAHLRGVIHRDLKPGNIRVDAAGEPHVLDFGLAKAAIGDTDAAMTVTGQFVGSLPWASPEQAEGQPSKIDVRTDVYSLGVILYQMLTGRFPYEVVGSMRDVLDRILRAEPTRPSTVRRQINDEVETIVLKCLSKERERRYQTAGELARDIQRYLSGQPIDAKRDSAMYVLKKTLRRYRVPVGIGAAVIVALVSVTAWALRERSIAAIALEREEAQRKQASEQRDLALARAKQTQEVADFQSDVLRNVDIESMGQGVKSRFRGQVRRALERQFIGEHPNLRKRTPDEIELELATFDRLASATPAADVARGVMDDHVLKPAAAAAQTKFAKQLLVRAQIEGAIGNAYRALSLYDAAESHLTAALSIRRRELGEDHELVAISFNDLALLVQDKGNSVAAEALLRQALEYGRKRLGDEHPDTLGFLDNLGSVLSDQGRYHEAEACVREALEARRRVLGAQAPHTIASVNNLGCVLQNQGRITEAEPYFREAVDGYRAMTGIERLGLVEALNNLASLLQDKGEYNEAESVYREALAVARQLQGDEHPDVAMILTNLADLSRSRGDYVKAEALFREALAMNRELLGEEHPSVAVGVNNLASVLSDLGRYSEAEQLFRDALAAQRTALGPEHPSVLTYAHNLADVIRRQGREPEAEAGFRDVLEARIRVLGPEHPNTLTTANDLGLALMAQGKLAEAETVFRDVLEARRRILGSDHPQTLTSINCIGVLLQRLGRFADAEPYSREALEARRRTLGPSHPSTLIATHNLGVLLQRQREFDQAETLLLSAWDASRALPRDHPLPPRVLESLVQLYDAWMVADPGSDSGAKAAEWRATLVEFQATTQQASSAPASHASTP